MAPTLCSQKTTSPTQKMPGPSSAEETPIVAQTLSSLDTINPPHAPTPTCERDSNNSDSDSDSVSFILHKTNAYTSKKPHTWTLLMHIHSPQCLPITQQSITPLPNTALFSQPGISLPKHSSILKMLTTSILSQKKSTRLIRSREFWAASNACISTIGLLQRERYSSPSNTATLWVNCRPTTFHLIEKKRSVAKSSACECRKLTNSGIGARTYEP